MVQDAAKACRRESVVGAKKRTVDVVVADTQPNRGIEIYAPDPSLSKSWNASWISCFCSSVSSNFFLSGLPPPAALRSVACEKKEEDGGRWRVAHTRTNKVRGGNRKRDK